MKLNDSALLSEITLIILSYNHPLKLERAIEHWRDLPVKVQILDGSDRPWFAVGPLPNSPNIIYNHMPRENNETSLQNYMNRAKYASHNQMLHTSLLYYLIFFLRNSHLLTS